jgi:hypothetical protein
MFSKQITQFWLIAAAGDADEDATSWLIASAEDENATSWLTSAAADEDATSWLVAVVERDASYHPWGSAKKPSTSWRHRLIAGVSSIISNGSMSTVIKKVHKSSPLRDNGVNFFWAMFM